MGGGVVLSPTGDARALGSGHLSAAYSVTGVQTEVTATADVRLAQSGERG